VRISDYEQRSSRRNSQQHDLTIRVCSGCHSPALTANEQLSPQGWHDLVHLMASQGAVATEEEFDQIAVYLAKSFPYHTRKEDK
jgi:hypothetical protein